MQADDVRAQLYEIFRRRRREALRARQVRNREDNPSNQNQIQQQDQVALFNHLELKNPRPRNDDASQPQHPGIVAVRGVEAIMERQELEGFLKLKETRDKSMAYLRQAQALLKKALNVRLPESNLCMCVQSASCLEITDVNVSIEGQEIVNRQMLGWNEDILEANRALQRENAKLKHQVDGRIRELDNSNSS